jgi:hypothetical protein
MTAIAQEATGAPDMITLADRGYYEGHEIRQCEEAGIAALVPKPLSSNSKPEGHFDKRDFTYDANKHEYRCPAGQMALQRFTAEERGKTIHKYWPSALPNCPLKSQCTTGDYRRISRWEHEGVLEVVQQRIDEAPAEVARLRRQTVEHVFGTLKYWICQAHFLT